jgi:hypothetical protein
VPDLDETPEPDSAVDEWARRAATFASTVTWNQGPDELASRAKRSALRDRSLLSIIVIAAVMVVVLVVPLPIHKTGSSPLSPRVGARHKLTSWKVNAGVPAGEPASLVPDPAGQAIWWWNTDDSGEVQVYKFGTATHRLTKWNVGKVSALGLYTGIQNGMAVGPDGDVWIGANLNLVRLDTSTGGVKLIRIPLSLVSGGRFSDISAIAANSSGQVAVVISDTSRLPMYNNESGKLSVIDLPKGTQAQDATYIANGTLGVALEPPKGNLANGRAMLIDPNGDINYADGINAGYILPDGDRFLVGLQDLYWVYPDGTFESGTGSEKATSWLAYPSTHPTWPISNGHIVSLARGSEGLVDLSPHGPAITIKLAKRPCGPMSMIGPPPIGGVSRTTRPVAPTTTTTPVCYAGVGAITVVGNNAWYLESYKNSTYVWEVNPA